MAMVSGTDDDGMLTVLGHPLIQHRLSHMREKSCPVPTFRALLRDIAMLLGATALADLPLESREIETPLERMAAPKLAGKPPIFAPVLRAGIGFLDGMLNLLPEAGVAHIGVYRDHKTLQAHEYYFRAPEDLAERLVILLDPMLATGNSAVAALDLLKANGAKRIRFICLLAATEGFRHVRHSHP
ncbi:MAG: uracil phosphoribosyltransferase, partial [Acetobacteraceae bacterium]